MENETNKHDYSTSTPEHSPEEKAGIVKRADFKLRMFSTYLGQQLDGLSARMKIILLALFFIFGISISMQTLVQSIWGNEKRNKVRIHSIPTGEKVLLQQQNRQFNLPTSADYHMILKFRKSLDSLKKSPEGLKEYQRFLNAHPGLLDSINEVQRQYELQNLN